MLEAEAPSGRRLVADPEIRFSCVLDTILSHPQERRRCPVPIEAVAIVSIV
jgi:hypothetical protein